MVFHENVKKNDKINEIDVWHIFNDKYYYVKIDSIVQQDHEQDQEKVQEQGESNMITLNNMSNSDTSSDEETT